VCLHCFNVNISDNFALSIKIDCMELKSLQPEQKALEINLDSKIYGTFAEIGAGQEVARIFFQVGAAAGTIAKTMSAYDKTYSDAIYGIEESGRYVCESRLNKMLDHEYNLMEERLHSERPETKFFVFADTVAAINYSKTIKGQGWLGVRFQLDSKSPPNDLIVHVKMLDNNTILQQESIGKLGANMIYGAYFYHQNPEKLVKSMMDGLDDRIHIDMIKLTGPDFTELDQRLLSLYLVNNELTDVAMFDSKGKMCHAGEFFYKKHLMVVRGHYRPPTNVTMDVFKCAFEQFKKDPNVDEDKARLVTELTLENLIFNGKLDEKDFQMRGKMLNSLDKTVMISSCNNHQHLINYLSDFKIQSLGLVIGARELTHIINEKYILNQDGRLLVAFGELFNRNITIYVYPAYDDDGQFRTSENLQVPEGIKFLYRHLLDCNQIVPIEGYNKEQLKIMPAGVMRDLLNGEENWSSWVPKPVAETIVENNFFGLHPEAVN